MNSTTTEIKIMYKQPSQMTIEEAQKEKARIYEEIERYCGQYGPLEVRRLEQLDNRIDYLTHGFVPGGGR